MKPKAFVSLCVTIFVAIAAISIPTTEVELSPVNLDQPELCEHDGLHLTAFFYSAVAQSGATGDLCEGGLEESSNEAVDSPVITLHQNADHMYITGEGFNASGRLDIAIHLMSSGTLGPAYSLHVSSQGVDAFTSEVTGVACEGPRDRLYVLVRDIHGNEHARIFEPGEFRCTNL